MEKRAAKINVTQNLPGLPLHNLSAGGKGLDLFLFVLLVRQCF